MIRFFLLPITLTFPISCPPLGLRSHNARWTEFRSTFFTLQHSSSPTAASFKLIHKFTISRPDKFINLSKDKSIKD